MPPYSYHTSSYNQTYGRGAESAITSSPISKGNPYDKATGAYENYDKGNTYSSYINTATTSSYDRTSMNSYERARQAVETARRELEERQRNAGITGRGAYSSSIYDRIGGTPRGQTTTTYTGSAASYSPKSSAPPFVTQAPRDDKPAMPTFVTQAPRDSDQTQRGGYSARSYAERRGLSTPTTLDDEQRNTATRHRDVMLPVDSPWDEREGAENGWERHIDPSSGNPFYHHAASGVSQWEVPRLEPRTARSPRALSSPHNASANTSPRRKKLVIDLDETLIHSQFEPCLSDLQVPMTMDGVQYTAYVHVRPGCAEFLKKAMSLCDVVIWTASLECYAGPVIDEIERQSGIGRLPRMFRESCKQCDDGGYYKDLRSCLEKGETSISHIAILDNTPAVARFNPSNLIGIQSWYDDRSDRALYDLYPLLERMATADNVYDAIRPGIDG